MLNTLVHENQKTFTLDQVLLELNHDSLLNSQNREHQDE